MSKSRLASLTALSIGLGAVTGGFYYIAIELGDVAGKFGIMFAALSSVGFATSLAFLRQEYKRFQEEDKEKLLVLDQSPSRVAQPEIELGDLGNQTPPGTGQPKRTMIPDSGNQVKDATNIQNSHS